MKKILIFSIILAVIAGIAGALSFALKPANYILDYAVYGEDTLYTISSYSHGTYLKTSDKNGVISSQRLKHQNGAYNGIIADNDRVYTIALTGTEIVVDEYDINGSYMKEMLRIPVSGLGFYDSMLEQYFVTSDNQSPKFLTDVVLLTEKGVLIYPIYKDTVQPMIRYDINSDTQIVWAQRGSDGLYYKDDIGQLNLLTNDGDIFTLNIGEGCVAYDPHVAYFSLYFTDLSSVSLTQCFAYYDSDANEYLMLDELEPQLLSSDAEIYDGVYFSELRNVNMIMDAHYRDNITGFKKEEGSFGKIYLFDPYTAMNVEFPEPGFEISDCLFVFAICAAAVFTAVLLLSVLIRRLLAIRKVIVKQIMLIIAIIAAVSTLVHVFLTVSMTNLVYSEIAALLTDTLDYISLNIDGDEFRDSGLTPQQRKILRDYEYRIESSITNKSDFISQYIKTGYHISFVEVARLTPNGYKYEFYSNQQPGAQVSYFITEEERLEQYTNMEANVDIISNSTELGTRWFEAVCSVTDSSGKQVGFIQIGSDTGSVSMQIERFVNTMTVFVILFITIISVLFLVIMAGLLRPLKKLKKAVSEVADGKIGTTLSISSNDELQDVAASFSHMSRQLQKYFNNINVISKAYEKYLPKGFFRLMGKDSVLDVKPGDHSSAELTYLFIGINQPSVHLTEEEGFNTLNGIYGVVTEVLGSTNGTIQSFSEKLITCIFCGGAAEAAETALTVQEKLRSRPNISGGITVAIQNSRSVIGVIGSGEAMKTITVSPAIELQACLSEIISRFNLTFIVTEEVLEELKNAGLNITARKIGRVNHLLGRDTRFDEMLNEILDGCPDEEKKLRQATLRSFEKAICAAKDGDFSEARAQLISVLRVNRGDLIARFILSNISGESEDTDNERSKNRLEIPN